MPITAVNNPDTGIVLVRLSGIVSYAEIRQILKARLHEARDEGTLTVFADVSDAMDIELGYRGALQLVRLLDEGLDPRVNNVMFVVFAPKMLGFGIGRLFELTASQVGRFTVAVDTDLEGALARIGVDREIYHGAFA